MTTRICQKSALPWEITDIIIDHLHPDVKALGVCGSVCSEWLIRSRHHLFYNVQLWPWRVQTFYELANERICTFTNHVRRIEVDDLRTRANGEEQSGVFEDQVEGNRKEQMLFKEVMSRPHPPCFASVHSIQIRNVDWTSLRIGEQTAFRVNLAFFAKLNRLEFQDVTFLDFREIVRIVESVPALHHLTVNVSFMKYLEYTLVSASAMCWPSNLRSIEIGTEDGLPVVLSCMANGGNSGRVNVLKLLNLKPKHLRYSNRALSKAGKNIQHLVLGFDNENMQWTNQEELSNTLDLSHLNVLRFIRITGLNIPTSQHSCALEKSLTSILQRIDSSFLDTIELCFTLTPGADLQRIDWRQLERVWLALHFFGMRTVCIFVKVISGVEEKDGCGANVERAIREAMPELHNRGVLTVHATIGGSK